jgi:hypothetical protein
MLPPCVSSKRLLCHWSQHSISNHSFGQEGCWQGQSSEQVRPAEQSVFDMWQAIYLAQKVGEGLGRSQVLLRQMQRQQTGARAA